MELDISTYHHIGKRDYQEDRYAVIKKFAGIAHLTLCMICDGHGGEQVSSYLKETYPDQLIQVFVEHMAQKRRTAPLQKEDDSKKQNRFVGMLGTALERCIEIWDRQCFGEAYEEVKEDVTKKLFFAKRNEKEWAKKGWEAGSTFVCMLIDMRKQRAHVVNIGDSRATWIVGDESIGTTVDHAVKRVMEPIKGCKFENKDGRLQGDLAMSHSVGDNTEPLYLVVSREYGSQSIDFKDKAFRAVIASDGLFDITDNHPVLYEEFPHATAVAEDALKRWEIELEARAAEIAARTKTPPPSKTKSKLVFEDNTSIIYVKLVQSQEDSASSLQKQLQEAQQLIQQMSNMMKEQTSASANTMVPKSIAPFSSSSRRSPSVEKRGTSRAKQKPDDVREQQHPRKHSVDRNSRQVQSGNVTLNLVRKNSRVK